MGYSEQPLREPESPDKRHVHPSPRRAGLHARRAELRTDAAAVGGVLAATGGFALVHSALASRAAKRVAVLLFGARWRNGAYRAFYNTQAAVTSAALILYLWRLPDRELYLVREPAATLMRAGQAGALLLLLDAARRVGILPLTGISSLAQLVRGDDKVLPEPEAQGPSLDEHGALRVGGAFLRSRHPLNLAPVPLLWLNPRMTRNLAVFSTIATAYFWLGSWHEEHRLLSAYGDRYRRYVRGRVPFFFGRRSITGHPAGPGL